MKYKEMGQGPYNLRSTLKGLYFGYFGSSKNISGRIDQNDSLCPINTSLIS